MKSILPNCRWLSVTSEHQGRDWFELSHFIDQQLDGLGMDLAEEAVYLLFSANPEAVLNEEGTCQVARSVIGPKKNVDKPLHLTDWVQAQVYRRNLPTDHWEVLLEECFLQWKTLGTQGHKLAPNFIVLLKRQINPELKLSAEVLFLE